MLHAQVLQLLQELSRHLLDFGLLGLGQLRLRPGEEVEDRQLLLRKPLTGRPALLLIHLRDQLLQRLGECLRVQGAEVIGFNQLLQLFDQVDARGVAGGEVRACFSTAERSFSFAVRGLDWKQLRELLEVNLRQIHPAAAVVAGNNRRGRDTFDTPVEGSIRFLDPWR